MRKLTIICLSGLLLSLAAAGYSYPTLWGPTGGAVLPTAEIASPNRLDLAADWYDSDFNATYPVRAVYGDRTWEIGALYAFNSDSNIWGANAKIGIPLSGRQGLALGAIYTNLDDIFTGTDVGAVDFTDYYLSNSTSVYLAYTYKFNKACPENSLQIEPGFRGTLGVNWTTEDFDYDVYSTATGAFLYSDSESDNAFRGYLAADYTFPNFLTIGGEIQTKSSELGETDPLGAAYIRYPFSPQFAAQVGVTNAFPGTTLGTDEFNWFAGLNFGFGPGSALAHRKGECTCPPPCPTQTEQYVVPEAQTEQQVQ